MDLSFADFFDSLSSFMIMVDSTNLDFKAIDTAIFNPEKFSQENLKVSSPKKAGFCWGEEHDKTLYSVTIKYKNDWKKIASRIKNLYNRKLPIYVLKQKFRSFKKNLDMKIVKFNGKDDSKLANAVKKYKQDWVKISGLFPEREPMTLRNRYYYLKKRGNL